MNQEKISEKLALQVAQLTYDKAALETLNEELQSRIEQLSSTEQVQAERIQDLEQEVVALKKQDLEVTQ